MGRNFEINHVLKKDEGLSLNSYFDKNTEKIDEAIVSLRLMKSVEEFLEINQISQREFAEKLGYSETYISQLMSGTESINTSFIKKLEKKYQLIVHFRLESIDQ